MLHGLWDFSSPTGDRTVLSPPPTSPCSHTHTPSSENTGVLTTGLPGNSQATICHDNWVYRNKPSKKTLERTSIIAFARNALADFHLRREKLQLPRRAWRSLWRARVEESYFAFPLKWSQEATGIWLWDLPDASFLLAEEEPSKKPVLNVCVYFSLKSKLSFLSSGLINFSHFCLVLLSPSRGNGEEASTWIFPWVPNTTSIWYCNSFQIPLLHFYSVHFIMGSQRIGHNWATELNSTSSIGSGFYYSHKSVICRWSGTFFFIIKYLTLTRLTSSTCYIFTGCIYFSSES